MEKSGGRFGIVMRINRRCFLRNVFRGGGGLVVAALLPGRSGQVKDDGLREFWADDLSANDFSTAPRAFLDGKDISNICTMFYGSKEPGVEVEGYVEVFPHWPPEWDPKKEVVITKCLYGKVRWEVRDRYEDK